MKYVEPIGGLADAPYVDANPVGGIEGSPVPAAAIEHPMRELVALIADAGLVPDELVLTQITTAVRTLIQKQAPTVAAAAGTADAITATYAPVIAALTNGMTLHFRAAAANATTTPTFTPAAGTIDAKTIVKGNNLPLVAGDIVDAAFWATVRYDLTLDKWVLENPATGINTGITQAQGDARYTGIGYMLVRDEKAQGTGGGTSAVGVNTRTLNTVSANTISGASLAANQVTLPAGTYRIKGRSPIYNVDGNKAYLYNVTDASTTIVGSSNDGFLGQNSDSFVNGRFSIAASKTFELRHDISAATATIGLGAASSRAAMVEVYTELEIIKEA